MSQVLARSGHSGLASPIALTLRIAAMFDLSARAQEIRERLMAFMREVVAPGEIEYHAAVEQPGQRWVIPAVMEEMKRKAKAASKTKYTCPACAANAWAKPETRLICGDCAEPMLAEG